MKRQLLLLFVAVAMLSTVALAEQAFNEDKVVAAIKVLMYREPCCGYCARLTPEQARQILTYLNGEVEPTGRELWANIGDKILIELDKIDPDEGQRVRRQAKSIQGRK